MVFQMQLQPVHKPSVSQHNSPVLPCFVSPMDPPHAASISMVTEFTTALLPTQLQPMGRSGIHPGMDAQAAALPPKSAPCNSLLNWIKPSAFMAPSKGFFFPHSEVSAWGKHPQNSSFCPEVQHRRLLCASCSPGWEVLPLGLLDFLGTNTPSNVEFTPIFPKISWSRGPGAFVPHQPLQPLLSCDRNRKCLMSLSPKRCLIRSVSSLKGTNLP